MNEIDTASGHPLSAELALFRARRGGWVADGREGSWAVVHRDRVLGFYRSVGDGFRVAVQTLQPGTFLVKEVTREERVHTIQQVCWK